jgi:hypothetical protein
MNRRHTSRLALGVLLTAAGLTGLTGCTIGQLIGGMASSFQRSGSHEVQAKYPDLHDKTFAVIIAADRSIQADFPTVVPAMTREISKMLADHSSAKGMLPPEEVLRYQAQHPGWVAKPFDALAKDLAVDRVVYIDLQDFALTDPGNVYVYNGIASGVVHVIETESATPGEFAFGEPVRIKYPDVSGVSPNQTPKSEVLSMLAKRFVDRAAWMFYTHEEPNEMKY